MIQKISVISFLIVLSFTLGCKKDKDPWATCATSGADCEDIQNVKHFFYFKVGSWWVYEEESSGLRDSVYVTSAVENPNNYDFDVEVYSTYQDYFYSYSPQYVSANGCSLSGIICDRCINVFRSKYKPGDFVATHKCAMFRPILGSKSYVWTSSMPDNYIELTDIVDTMSILGQEFGRTFRITELNTHMEGDQPTEHYFSEYVGLVKKELLDSNEVWNLIDYHIEQ